MSELSISKFWGGPLRGPPLRVSRPRTPPQSSAPTVRRSVVVHGPQPPGWPGTSWRCRDGAASPSPVPLRWPNPSRLGAGRLLPCEEAGNGFPRPCDVRAAQASTSEAVTRQKPSLSFGPVNLPNTHASRTAVPLRPTRRPAAVVLEHLLVLSEWHVCSFAPSHARFVDLTCAQPACLAVTEHGPSYCVSMRATSQGVPFAVLARTRLIHTKWTSLAPVQWWSP